MKKKRLITMIGSVCLILVLAALLLPACAPRVVEAPELEAKIKALEGELTSEKAEVSKLEKELAEAAVPAKVYKWRMSSWAASGTPVNEEYFPIYTDSIRAMSDGRVDIEIFGCGEIVDAVEMLEATGEGLVDICNGCACYEDGVWPGAVALYGLPFSFQTIRQSEVWFEYLGVLDFVNKEVYHPLNVHGIAFCCQPFVRLGTKVPINTLDDLKGLKLRAVGAPVEVWKKLGASVTYIPYPEVYMAAATGVIDGQSMGGFEEQWAVHMHEVEGYWLDVAIQPQHNVQYVNMDSWNALPDDLKEIVHVASRYLNSIISERQVYGDTYARKDMLASGVQLTTLSASDMAKLYEVAAEVWDEIAATDEISAELVRRCKEYMEFLGYME